MLRSRRGAPARRGVLFGTHRGLFRRGLRRTSTGLGVDGGVLIGGRGRRCCVRLWVWLDVNQSVGGGEREVRYRRKWTFWWFGGILGEKGRREEDIEVSLRGSSGTRGLCILILIFMHD